jgi:tetratricopeptide (TPR) repeat protein
MPQEKKDFFISYTSADRQWAEWIAWHLEDAGYSTIIQAWDFHPSSNFALNMQRALESTHRAIAVLSPRYLQSAYAQAEWAAAFADDPTGEKGLLIPVRIERCELMGLHKAIVYIDLVQKDKDEARSFLLRRIEHIVTKKRPKPENEPDFPGSAKATPSAASQSPRFPGTLPAGWNVPLQRNPNFTSREEILTELREQFGASAKQIIHGLGGVGKSQIVAEFCYRNAASYGVVWWLRAEEESSLIAGFTALAKALELPQSKAQEQEIVIQAVRQWLDRHGDWLLIFDNARDAESLRGYLPQGASGHALMTSRNPDWRHVGTSQEIVKWLRPDSVAFLQKRTGKDDPAAADGIADELGDLPLALEQAGAYICQKQKSLAEYLADFQQFRTELWKREKKPSDYPDTVATTWLMAFEAIEDVPLAKELLLLSSVVAPDNIPKSLVKRALEYAAGQDGEPAAISNFDLDDARGALCSYSLLSADTDTFSIHRLVQTVAQDRTDEDEIARYRAIMLNVLSEQFPREGYNNPAFWPECEQLLAHAEKIAEEGKPMVETATLLNSMGSYYHGRTFYAKAEPLYRRSLQIREDFLGSGNPDVATNLNNLASLLKDQGKYGEAEPLHRRALKIREEQLGGGHPDVAQSLNNLASLLQDQGKYGEAEPLYRRSLKIREGHFGNEHPDVAGGLNNLAGLLRAQGMYAEAEPLYRRSLTIWEDQLGSEHPVVAISLNNFALLLYAQGKYTEAEPLYRRSMKIWEEQLGGEHPNVAASLNNLGGLLKEQGKYAEAEALFERAVQICENVLGESHPNTITAKENLAVLWKDMSKG